MSTEQTPSDSERELQILVVMRQVLSSIIKDTTPPPGMQHPLQGSTIEDIKQCFALITAREKEIHGINGSDSGLRPRYRDEPRTSQVVPFIKPSKNDD
jgi:hypothetical protein